VAVHDPDRMVAEARVERRLVVLEDLVDPKLMNHGSRPPGAHPEERVPPGVSPRRSMAFAADRGRVGPPISPVALRPTRVPR
jgi:hypothetical protein